MEKITSPEIGRGEKGFYGFLPSAELAAKNIEAAFIAFKENESKEIDDLISARMQKVPLWKKILLRFYSR